MGGQSAVPPGQGQSPAERMMAAIEKELKTARQQLHRAGQYAGMTQALSLVSSSVSRGRC